MSRKKVAVLTGAGISAESGISTFRDSDGLWENHDVMEVASIDGYRRNPALMHEFYNQRRRQLKEVFPNKAHELVAKLQDLFDVVVITQNVDDLHERAGSKNIIHLHGELIKARSTKDDTLIYNWSEDLNIGDLCEKGSQLRPHIVWFGEAVPMIEHAVFEIETAEIIIVIGTSMQVYPAASLVHYAPPQAEYFYIDPKPALSAALSELKNLTILSKKATDGMEELYKKLTQKEIINYF